ncbi:MAG: sulfotransferase [Candidatus Lustribacter sp.]|jgi:tetratricopeptide (TPR) repeat protein
MSSPADAEQIERAIAAAQRALAADANSARTWHDLGVLYQLRGTLDESRAAFERAAELEPTFASAHNNLGNSYARLGDNERAAQSYRRALECDPSLMAAHANAAVALHVLGRHAEALEHARRAIELDPASTPARITAAFIEGALNGYGTALAQIDALLAGAPGDLTALAARAYCLLRLERYAEALATAERGLALQPGAAALLESLGCALRGLGRADEALEAFERTLAHGGDRPSILVLMASTLLEIGKLAEAERTFEAALALAPDLATAWGPLVELRSFAPGDPALARMEGFLETSPNLRGSEARTLMHFALGKAYRKSGDPPNAFRHFAAGNALKRSSIVYDVATDERFARDTIAFFTPATMRRLAGRGDSSRAPIFVVGMPRSGTSLVEQILASHPGVHGAGELLLFDRALAEAGSDDPAALGARYLELLDAVAPAERRVVDKLPSNFRHVALLHAALPRARIVHCVRDPIDTCFSCYTTHFTGRQDFSWDLTEAGRYYRAYAALMEHWRSILPPGVMLDVRYEDLIAAFEENTRRLLAFCDLPWDDAVLRFYETERPIRTASYRQARQPLYTTSVRAADAYRAELRPLIEALAGG